MQKEPPLYRIVSSKLLVFTWSKQLFFFRNSGLKSLLEVLINYY